MSIQGIHLSWIVVQNLKEAIRFYTDTVGLQLMEEHPDFGWAELEGPSGSRLGIAEESPRSEIKAGSNAVLTITVDHLETTLKEFIKKGGKVEGEPMEVPGHVKIQSFRDRDNNLLQFVQVLSP